MKPLGERNRGGLAWVSLGGVAGVKKCWFAGGTAGRKTDFGQWFLRFASPGQAG